MARPMESPTRTPGRWSNRRLEVIKGLFLIAGALSFLLSVYLWFWEDETQGIFVGLWVPSMWSLGALLLAGEGRDR
jgi:hypothetical protein